MQMRVMDVRRPGFCDPVNQMRSSWASSTVYDGWRRSSLKLRRPVNVLEDHRPSFPPLLFCGPSSSNQNEVSCSSSVILSYSDGGRANSLSEELLECGELLVAEVREVHLHQLNRSLRPTVQAVQDLVRRIDGGGWHLAFRLKPSSYCATEDVNGIILVLFEKVEPPIWWAPRTRLDPRVTLLKWLIARDGIRPRRLFLRLFPRLFSARLGHDAPRQALRPCAQSRLLPLSASATLKGYPKESRGLDLEALLYSSRVYFKRMSSEAAPATLEAVRGDLDDRRWATVLRIAESLKRWPAEFSSALDLFIRSMDIVHDRQLGALQAKEIENAAVASQLGAVCRHGHGQLVIDIADGRVVKIVPMPSYRRGKEFDEDNEKTG